MIILLNELIFYVFLILQSAKLKKNESALYLKLFCPSEVWQTEILKDFSCDCLRTLMLVLFFKKFDSGHFKNI